MMCLISSPPGLGSSPWVAPWQESEKLRPLSALRARATRSLPLGCTSHMPSNIAWPAWSRNLTIYISFIETMHLAKKTTWDFATSLSSMLIHYYSCSVSWSSEEMATAAGPQRCTCQSVATRCAIFGTGVNVTANENYLCNLWNLGRFASLPFYIQLALHTANLMLLLRVN